MPLLSIFAPASSRPPSLAWSRIYRQPGWCSRLPAATAHLCLPPILGGPKEFLVRVIPDFPSTFAPPFRPRPVPRSLSSSVFLHTGAPTSIWLSPSTSRLLPPHPAGLDRWPSPLPVLVGGVMFPPVPCASTFPYPCSTPYFGVFCSVIPRVSFCSKT